VGGKLKEAFNRGRINGATKGPKEWSLKGQKPSGERGEERVEPEDSGLKEKIKSLEEELRSLREELKGSRREPKPQPEPKPKSEPKPEPQSEELK